MKLRKYLALICAVAMLLVLVSCGGRGAQTMVLDVNDPQIEDNEVTDPDVTGADGEVDPAPAAPKTGSVTGTPGERDTSDNSPTESANSETEKGNGSSATNPGNGNSGGNSSSGSGNTGNTGKSGSNSGSGSGSSSSGSSGKSGGGSSSSGSGGSGPGSSGGSTTPQPTQPTQPVHTHSYSETVVGPTCIDCGYTLHTCSCGDSYTDSYVSELGHAWDPIYETRTHDVTEMRQITYCVTCGADLTNLSDEDFTAHCKAHVLAGESDQTRDVWEEVVVGTETEEVLVGYKCSRCGETK